MAVKCRNPRHIDCTNHREATVPEVAAFNCRSNTYCVSKFLKVSILLILTSSVLILLISSCTKNPAEPDGIYSDLSEEDSIAVAEAINNGYIPIRNFHELYNIGADKDLPLDTKYILVRDIDASPSRRVNNEWGFRPIGTNTKPFTGEFDGRGQTIRNLYIRRPNPDTVTVGLFGFIMGARIHRLHVEVDLIWGNSNAGGIVGDARNSVIDSCSFRGNVRGRRDAGGIAGKILSSHISRSISEGTVSSDTLFPGGRVGGLTGELDTASIDRSYSTADVFGTHSTGGLVGYNYQSQITNSYSTGNVDGRNGSTGGLVGQMHDGTVAGCYSTGDIIYTPAGRAGGLVGERSQKSVIANSFWGTLNTEIIADSIYADTVITVDSAGVTDTAITILREQEVHVPLMRLQRTYTGWNFNTIWNIDEGKSTPYFMWHEK